MNNRKIIIAGGTGFIGQALASAWGRDNEVIILSRYDGNSVSNRFSNQLIRPSHTHNITYRRWDAMHPEKHWTNELEGADILLNLAGKSVNCRYNDANKKAILSSRINSTKALGKAVASCIHPPKVWLNAASATIYRHAMDLPQDEYTGEMQDDFSVQVCKQWEQCFLDQTVKDTRKIILRMAITLGDGGVMAPFRRLVGWGLGGRQGNGRQMFSWIHIDDLRRAIEFLSEYDDCSGIFNSAAPRPVTNRFFMETLRRSMQAAIGLPAPALLLTLGAAIIGTETELLLKSRWVVPSRLVEKGFIFRYPVLPSAIAQLCQTKADKPERNACFLNKNGATL